MDTHLLNTNSEIDLLNAVFADQVEPVLRLTVKYDRHANLRVSTENVSLIKVLNASTGTVGISADNLQNSIEVFCHTTGFSEAGKPQAIIIVSNPPLTVFSGGDIMMASYRVSNFCYLERLKTIQLQDEIHKFEYNQFDSVKDARCSVPASGGSDLR
jgi:hypothetical protein